MAPPCPGCSEDKIYAELDYDGCIGETVNALRLQIDDAEVWIPKSLFDPEETLPTREENPAYGEAVRPETVFVEEWYAIKNGLV